LRAQFGSWFLALAAYNGGPGRVGQLLRRHVPLAEPHDSLYLAIGPYLPAETREFVARFLAGARIASDPEAFGIAAPVALTPFAWEEVVVSEASSIDVLARAAGASELEIRALNPHLLRGMTVRGSSTTVRVPPGAAGAFKERWDAIPAAERITVTEHRVVSGETLSRIAQAYGIRLEELQAANPGVDSRRLRIGQSLIVPLLPTARRGI
jgi:membrane-bound lytic murein transglycosylase D